MSRLATTVSLTVLATALVALLPLAQAAEKPAPGPATTIGSGVSAIPTVGGGTVKAAPGDWPQWRGPNRDGISMETGLLKEWPADGPPLLWKIKGLGRRILGRFGGRRPPVHHGKPQQQRLRVLFRPGDAERGMGHETRRQRASTRSAVQPDGRRQPRLCPLARGGPGGPRLLDRQNPLAQEHAHGFPRPAPGRLRLLRIAPGRRRQTHRHARRRQRLHDGRPQQGDRRGDLEVRHARHRRLRAQRVGVLVGSGLGRRRRAPVRPTSRPGPGGRAGVGRQVPVGLRHASPSPTRTSRRRSSAAITSSARTPTAPAPAS